MVQDMAARRDSSIQPILSTAPMLGFRLFSHDVTQAYLQSKHRLSSITYIKVKQKDLQAFGLKRTNV